MSKKIIRYATAHWSYDEVDDCIWIVLTERADSETSQVIGDIREMSFNDKIVSRFETDEAIYVKA